MPSFIILTSYLRFPIFDGSVPRRYLEANVGVTTDRLTPGHKPWLWHCHLSLIKDDFRNSSQERKPHCEKKCSWWSGKFFSWKWLYLKFPIKIAYVYVHTHMHTYMHFPFEGRRKEQSKWNIFEVPPFCGERNVAMVLEQLTG